MNNYLLVIYKPSSKERRGCSCHGYDIFYDSELSLKRFCNENDLVKELKLWNSSLKENKENFSPYKISIFRNNEPIYQDNDLRLFKSDRDTHYLSWSDDYPECNNEYPVQEIERIIAAMQLLLKDK